MKLFSYSFTVTYSEKIPESAPPSYKGQSVRFSYKITIGIGSINGPTKPTLKPR